MDGKDPTDGGGWLILSRAVGQKIIIGERLVEIVLVEVSGGRARIGFRAPKNLSIDREEIYCARTGESMS